MREITFDTETTGMDPNSGHRIVEIGCVELIDKTPTGNSFHAYINPQRDVPKAATDVHGLTDAFLKDKPVFSDIAKDFVKFIGRDKLVIHNASFDLKFINYELTQVKIPTIEYERAIDTLAMARVKFPGAKVNLDALCKRFSIDLSRREKHGALLDAELLADVYIELLGGRQTMLLQENRPEEPVSSGKKVVFFDKNKKIRVPRRFEIPAEDLENHEKFLKKIKDPLWG